MSRTQAAIVAVLVLIVSAIGLTACGGDDDDGGAATATATQQGSQATAEPTDDGDEPTDEPTDGPDETDAPSNNVSDLESACDLLSTEEVEAELGDTVFVQDGGVIDAPVGNGSTAPVSSCGWVAETGTGSVSLRGGMRRARSRGSRR